MTVMDAMIGCGILPSLEAILCLSDRLSRYAEREVCGKPKGHELGEPAPPSYYGKGWDGGDDWAMRASA